MPRPDERIDEGLIHAWLDGELGADEAARVERLVAEHAEWAAAAAEARGLVAASSRILSALDVVAGDVIPRGGSAAPAFGASRATKPDIAPKVASRRAIPTWLRVAAGAVLVAGVAYMSRTATDTARVTEVGARSDEVVAAPAIASEPVAADAPALNKEVEQGIVASAASAAAPKRSDAPSALPAPSRAAEKTAPKAVSAPAPQALVADAVVAPAPEAKAAARRIEPLAAQPQLRGVAGGVASGVTPSAAGGAASMAAAQGSVAAAARADAANKAEFTTAERRAAESRALRQATAAPNLLPNTIDGCWRLETTARADSIQRGLPVVRISGDTTFTVLAPNGITAWVVRDSPNALRGRTRDSTGATVPLSATQVGCPVSP